MRSLPATVACAVLALAGCGKPVSVYKTGEMSAASVSLPLGRRSIALVGDIMTWDDARANLEKHGARYPFLATAPLLQGADLAVGNLEGPVATKATRRESRFPYKVPPWTLQGLKWAGFDAVSFANNHVADCGVGGMLETFESLRVAGIPWFGAGQDPPEAQAPRVFELGGRKVAFVGFVAADTWFHEFEDSLEPGAYRRMERGMTRRFGVGKGRPGAVIATAQSVAQGVRAAEEAADVVIAVFHFGIRYHRAPEEFQRGLAHAAVDAGADLVVGHHAHFWQPAEVYKGKPIVYGVGNFAFGSGNREADEGLLVRAVLEDGRMEAVELFPLYIKNADDLVDFQPKVMKGASADEMLGRVSEASRPLGARIAIEKGRGVLRLGQAAGGAP
ncbi:MAG: CapA family protein [Deltaproteobacteria bacterium]|nr:CapA family protein [Deltaproteobacteria bacterium]